MLRMRHKSGVRLLCTLLAFLLLAAVCVAGVYGAANLHHDCPGEDCPVCANMHMLLSLVAGFALLLPVTAVVWAALHPSALGNATFTALTRGTLTPVLLFDRMND